jgi:hypothetical protein
VLSATAAILFGAGFTVTICYLCGTLLIRRLPSSFFYREEAALFAFVLGTACLQIVIFLLGLFHLASAWIIFGGGAGFLALAARAQRRPLQRQRLPKPPTVWWLIFLVVYGIFFIFYFTNSLAPEVSPDGSGYHLGNVYRMWQAHGFAWGYHSIYSHMPQGMEMLFLVAYSFGGPSAAALVHFTFFSILPLFLVCYGCRRGLPRAGIFAAILVYAAPVCGVTGVAAYNDLALATVIFAEFYLLQLISEENNVNQFIYIGLLAGECFALKYTGALVAPFAGILLAKRRRRAGLRPVGIALAAAAIVALPWVLRNWFWLGNPAAPFLNSWFPNPYYSPELEKGYLADLASYPHFQHFWDLPLEFILFGRVLPGFTGPGFLLTPLALLALRKAEGRNLLFAAILFGIPIGLNAAVRFLIPALPFLSLAIGMAITEPVGFALALAVCHAILCWPSVVSHYCAPWAWRLQGFPIRAALRLEPEPKFLQRRLGDYAWKEPIERLVPPGARIFTDAGRPEAYIHRELIVSYESLLGYEAEQALAAPLANPLLRTSSTQKLKRLGFSYVLLNDTNPLAADLRNHWTFWRAVPLAAINGARLYRLN